MFHTENTQVYFSLRIKFGEEWLHARGSAGYNEQGRHDHHSHHSTRTQNVPRTVGFTLYSPYSLIFKNYPKYTTISSMEETKPIRN